MRKKSTKKENHSITLIYKEHIDDSELDLTLYDEILGKDWSDKEDKEGRHGIIRKGNDNQYGWQGESHAISIDRLLEHLNKLKEKGCNYVELDYHCDHIGYNIYGLDIHRSTDKEVADEKNKNEKQYKANKAAKIKELTAELTKLKKS